MSADLTPLRDEHRELRPHIDGLRAAGDAVGAEPWPAAAAAVDAALDFLEHHLAPHASAEDAALYPEVQRVMGAAQATATMSRDHVEVHSLTASLRAARGRAGDAGPDPAGERELRRLLYGLHALVTVHFAKEEEIYVPLLETTMTDEQARAMFTAMGHAAHGMVANPPAGS